MGVIVEEDRLKQMQDNTKLDWKGKKVLYIGANSFRFHYKDFLKENDCIVDVIEIVPEACSWLKRLGWINRVYCDDIKNVKNYNGPYDIILWSHGPETVEEEYIPGILDHLESLGDVVLMVPWGNCKFPDNITPFVEEFFIERGYKTNTLGKKDDNGSNLLAWKIKEE